MIEITKNEDSWFNVIINNKIVNSRAFFNNGFFETDDLLLSIDSILSHSTNEFPNNFILKVRPDINEDNFIFDFVDFIKNNNSFKIKFATQQYGDTWEGKWSPKTYLQKIAKHASYEQGLTLIKEEYDDEGLYLEFDFEYPGTQSIKEIYKEGKRRLLSSIKNAEVELNGFYWKPVYDKNEELFSKEVIHPLLLRLKFFAVKYSHGRKEYGKDFTFSELDKFGQERNYGLQVKAGDISGKVNSKIDEIIGQIEDAFAMPYYAIGSKKPKYISTFIVAISGNFRENAKEKIAEKLPKGCIGSIYFMDKETILELIYKSWNH